MGSGARQAAHRAGAVSAHASRAATTDLVFRPAMPNDIDAILAIEEDSFSDPWAGPAFSPLVNRDHVYFVVATRAGEVIGYAVAYVAGGEAEIANFAVAGLARGQGVGGILLRHLLTTLRDAAAIEVWLDVRASNAAARALYGRFGFQEVGRRRGYYRRPVEDAISMRRDLADATE